MNHFRVISFWKFRDARPPLGLTMNRIVAVCLSVPHTDAIVKDLLSSCDDLIWSLWKDVRCCQRSPMNSVDQSQLLIGQLTRITDTLQIHRSPGSFWQAKAWLVKRRSSCNENAKMKCVWTILQCFLGKMIKAYMDNVRNWQFFPF